MAVVTFKSPDLHKPRNRQKAINFLAYPDKDPHGFFSQMKQDHPDLAQFANREIAGWLKTYLKGLADEVLNNRKGVELPGNLGVVMIGLSKLPADKKTFNIDFNASRQVGYRVHHHNLHTDGLLAKIYYYGNIPRRRLKIHNLVSFSPCRKLSRSVAAMMRENGIFKQFMVFSKYFRISNLYHRRKITRYTMEGKVMADYDPFSIDL
ncbi:MAG: hypothetical protein JSS82_08100 [Bacteroidetes bacterium]|nr:hypothetical protein [Bacteroidota bacterium]